MVLRGPLCRGAREPSLLRTSALRIPTVFAVECPAVLTTTTPEACYTRDSGIWDHSQRNHCGLHLPTPATEVLQEFPFADLNCPGASSTGLTAVHATTPCPGSCCVFTVDPWPAAHLSAHRGAWACSQVCAHHWPWTPLLPPLVSCYWIQRHHWVPQQSLWTP